MQHILTVVGQDYLLDSAVAADGILIEEGYTFFSGDRIAAVGKEKSNSNTNGVLSVSGKLPLSLCRG